MFVFVVDDDASEGGRGKERSGEFWKEESEVEVEAEKNNNEKTEKNPIEFLFSSFLPCFSCVSSGFSRSLL